MGNKVYEEEIDLGWLLYALIKNLWLIIAVAIICACGTAGYTHFRIQPIYTSTSTMLVLTKETTLTSLADLQLGTQLTKDYTVLITSRPVLNEVIENLDLQMDYKSLRSRIAIENPEDTRILKISVTTNNPNQAKAIVDELASVSSVFIGDKLEVTPPKIIEEGESTGIKAGPNLMKNTAIGFVVGAFFVCIVIIVLEILNDTIQTEEDIEKYLKMPALAVIPQRNSSNKKGERGFRNLNKRGRAQ